MAALKLFSLLLLFTSALPSEGASHKNHYIVYMGHHSFQDSESVIGANHEMLASVTGTSHDEVHNAAVHHYTKTFRGFSAMLTSDQARKLEENDLVVSVFESKISHIHTTHSWDFLGINKVGEYQQSVMDSVSDIIIGVIDSGVWPESKSFDDYGLGPVPTKFKGVCSTGENFTQSNCNRKIVGARFYYKGFIAENGPLESENKPFFLSPRDADGHGTHTASTVAGSMVPNANVFGTADGTARGGAPSARLAIYKACWFGFCSDADILGAMDDAISDGVDVISMSLGPDSPQPVYFNDVNSIGSFHAFEKGVVVSASAGNSFLPKTATNVAPWILTVAASTMDREIQTHIYLGNSSLVIKGSSINPTEMVSFHSLVFGSAAAAPGIPSTNASFCKNNTLDPTLIKGKIVVCQLEEIFDHRNEKNAAVKQGGGVGIVVVDPLAQDISFQFSIPGIEIGAEEAQKLQAYMASQKNPLGRITRTRTALSTKPAPQMAMFSSMGPNVVTPDIIKPDVTAPGVNVVAAWSPLATENTAGRSIDYNIISGTSMACPHVSAVAAILKSFHPSWSPAAIKSAIMTTATIQDNTGSTITRHPTSTPTSPFDYGSGHVNPAAAVDPGLIYDYDTADIIDFLCSTGATSNQLKNLTGVATPCRNTTLSPYDFNYPSIGVANMMGKTSVYRTVTYYGKGPAVYKAKLEYPAGAYVAVTPKELSFAKMGDKMSFVVNFTPYNVSKGNFVFGALTWTDGMHVVRSPIGINILSL